MLKKYLFFIAILAFFAKGYSQTVSSDTDWAANTASLKSTMEADFIIRAGDVDNLGFGWPEGFDPFCGRMTESHVFPWSVNPDDMPGLDRILLSGKFIPGIENRPCGGEGYSETYDPAFSKPVALPLKIDLLKGAEIKNAYLQMFIDDFQAPSFCSKYQLTLNGVRFVEGEKILNAIDQTGPVGKMVTMKIPEEFYPTIIAGGVLNVKVDEVTGAADGFALDFIRLLVNRKRENTCKGDVSGYVRDKETNEPIANARVICSDAEPVISNEEGYFLFKNIPTGFELASASAPGYSDGNATADIGEGSENPEILIMLEKGQNSAMFDGKGIKAGETINLNKILFDLGKADLRPESKTELDKIAEFMKANPTAEIELSGHTSSEGDAAMNRSLSYRRVKACKDYIVAKGTDTGRIVAVGYGPDRPVAPNDTETNRAQNRRVEMRILKL